MSSSPWAVPFTGASVILPVMNETFSLRQTVEIILRDARADVREFLIVVCSRTTPRALTTVAQLQSELESLVVVHEQQLPFLGGALREAFDLARGSHVILMASDLETDPRLVKTLIEHEKSDPGGIVTASRWMRGGSFRGYSGVKLILNWVFQRCFSLMYASNLTDMTYAYRIMPTRLVQAIRWEELRHPFLFETLIKPLKLGVRVTEIPAAWKARLEGESQNTFLRNFVYFRIGLKTRFAARARLLREAGPDRAWLQRIPQ
ncbi:MAG: glycosyltransferase family 2 protein [Steroidobacteraceae bacterium]